MKTAIIFTTLVTLGNCLCGIYAIYATLSGHVIRAGMAVFLGMVFDLLDGKLARYTHSGSRFGTYIDSLSDFVSFGIAPAFIIYKAYGNVIGVLLPIGMYVIAGLWRLVRYMHAEKNRTWGIFQGLPIPVAAGMILSIVISARVFNVLLSTNLIGSILIVLSLLMISKLRYAHIAKIYAPIPSFVKILILISVSLILFTPYFFVFSSLCFLWYIVFGVELKHVKEDIMKNPRIHPVK